MRVNCLWKLFMPFFPLLIHNCQAINYFIPGGNCGISQQIRTVKHLSEEDLDVGCVFTDNKEDYHRYLAKRKAEESQLIQFLPPTWTQWTPCDIPHPFGNFPTHPDQAFPFRYHQFSDNVTHSGDSLSTTYKMFMFENITATTGSIMSQLGVWGNFTGVGEALYDEMTFDYGVGGRKSLITLKCGETNHFYFVNEYPAKTFNFIFKSPGVCRRYCGGLKRSRIPLCPYPIPSGFACKNGTTKFETCPYEKCPSACDETSGCCTSSLPCRIDEGMCSNDTECEDFLVCGSKNCPIDKSKSCCRAPCKGSGDCCGNMMEGGLCKIDEGTCQTQNDCIEGATCGYRNCNWNNLKHCCRLPCEDLSGECCGLGKPKGLCRNDEGICSADEDCIPGSICAHDNCLWSGNVERCCRSPCEDPSQSCCGLNSAGGQCLMNEGKCYFNSDCYDNLVCGFGNCNWNSSHGCCREVCNSPSGDCCGSSSPFGLCKIGEGACFLDTDCLIGYVCGLSNCDWNSNVACCRIPCRNESTDCCGAGKSGGLCKINEGVCESSLDCQTGLVCGAIDSCSFGPHRCCRLPCTSGVSPCCGTGSAGGPCLLGEGECTSNSDCDSGLVCGRFNCPWDSSKHCCRSKCESSSLTCCGDGQVGGKCLIDEGICDADADCVNGMVCGRSNCPWDSSKNCCRQKCTDTSLECCGDGKAGGRCLLDEGNCDSDNDCWDSNANVCTAGACSFATTGMSCCRQKCNALQLGCCTQLASKGGRCREGEGQCNADSDCDSGFVCKQGSCPGAQFGNPKCCRISCKSLAINLYECCRSSARSDNSLVTFPCDVDEGDCDVDEDCIGSLSCGSNNCPWDSANIEDCCR